MGNSKLLGIVAGLALVLSVVGLVLTLGVRAQLANSLGGSVIEHVQTDFVNGFKVAADLIFDGTSGTPTLNLGANGTNITDIIEGTCNPATTQLPLEATSTDQFTCTVTGLTTSFQCDVSLENRDEFYGGFIAQGPSASTNTLTFGILNLTGVSTSSFAQATTSAKYHCEK